MADYQGTLPATSYTTTMHENKDYNVKPDTYYMNMPNIFQDYPDITELTRYPRYCTLGVRQFISFFNMFEDLQLSLRDVTCVVLQ
jgi:hypothetical protein